MMNPIWIASREQIQDLGDLQERQTEHDFLAGMIFTKNWWQWRTDDDNDVLSQSSLTKD